MATLALIGGTGVYDPDLLDNRKTERIETPYGTIEVQIGEYLGKEIAFLPRHGHAHSIPPHKINHRANLMGLKLLGVRRIIGTAAVGSLSLDMHPGHFVIVDQFIDFTKSRHTFRDGGLEGVVHVDVTEPYCPKIRQAAIKIGEDLPITVHPHGVYLCVEGPRYETSAEIRMFQMWGADVVGMTNVPEAVLAREAGMCYGAIATVTNMAAGLSKNPLSHDAVSHVMASNIKYVRQLTLQTLIAVADDERCACEK